MSQNAAESAGAGLPAIIGISSIATLGGFLFGFDSGVINGTQAGLARAFNLTDVGWAVASMLLGCAVGAFFAGRLGDILGRRALLLVAAVFFTISAWGSGVAMSEFEFVLYRVLGGLAVGAASVMAPAYIAEVAPASVRGRLLTIQQIAIIFGLFMAFVSNYLIALSAGSALNPFWFGIEAWRWMYWMEIAPAALYFVALFAVPESPRYLMLRRKPDSARRVLAGLYGDAAAGQKITEIEASIAADHKPRLADLFQNGRVRPIVWVGLGLAIFQQLVGINVVFYYGSVLWQAVGFSEGDALLINVLSGGISIGACLVALALIDRIGRKPLLWVGSAGMTVTLAAMAYAFSTASLVDGALKISDAMGLVALVAANAYVAFFNASWGPVMWVMLGEMFPNQIRGSGLAVSGLAQWGSNFGITLTFPMLLATIGLAGAYGIYAACAAVSVWFVLAAVRETRGKELEEMQG